MGYKRSLKKAQKKREIRISKNYINEKKEKMNQKNAFDSIAKNAMKGAGMPIAKKGNKKGVIKKLAGVSIFLVILGFWKLVELLIYFVVLCF